MKTIAFFNNKGGVGKTSLVYHLAWMYADLGLSVVAADLDPQANLTSMLLKQYRSLMPLAQEARRPIFFLKPADGAIGSHMTAVQDCYRDFRDLAKRIARRCGVVLPSVVPTPPSSFPKPVVSRPTAPENL